MTNHLELLIQVGEPRLSDGEFLPIKNFSTEVALVIGEGDRHIDDAVKNLQAMVCSLFLSSLMRNLVRKCGEFCLYEDKVYQEVQVFFAVSHERGG